MAYLANGVRQRFDTVDDESVQSHISTPSLQFLVSRDATSAFKLDELVHRSTPNGDQSIRLAARLVHAPYCFDEMRIVDVLIEKFFSIREAQEVDLAGEKAIKVAWKCTFKDEIGELTRIGEWWFRPTRSWVLQQQVIGVEGKPGGLWRVYQYDKQSNGVPIIKSADYWTDYGDGVRKKSGKSWRCKHTWNRLLFPPSGSRPSDYRMTWVTKLNGAALMC